MKREEDLLLYMKCWLEMKIFLTEVVRDDAEGYPYAKDILKLMRAIELKMEGEDGTSNKTGNPISIEILDFLEWFSAETPNEHEKGIETGLRIAQTIAAIIEQRGEED